MSLFPQEDVQRLLKGERQIGFLHVRAGAQVAVYVGASQESRMLRAMHFDSSTNTSWQCSGVGLCRFCERGHRATTYLYVAVKTAGFGKPYVASVSRDVANSWLAKAPNFKNQFVVHRPAEKNKGVTLQEVLTHGALPAEWEGFDVAAEFARLMGQKHLRFKARADAAAAAAYEDHDCLG